MGVYLQDETNVGEQGEQIKRNAVQLSEQNTNLQPNTRLTKR